MNIKATIQKLNLSATENKLTLKVFDGIPEAPDDGKQYGRRSKQWQEIEGGTTDIDDTVTEESQNAVKSSGIWASLTALWDNFMTALGLHTSAPADAHTASSITVSAPVTPDYTAPEIGDTMQDVTNKVAGLQLQSGGKVNALGNITGATQVNLSNGTFVMATLTGAVELTFTGLPNAGFVKDFTLLFTNIETITFPVGTKFAGGVPPVVIASPYLFVCSIDSTGVLTVYSVIDNIIVPV